MREVGQKGADELSGSAPVSCLAFSPDASTLAAGYHDSTLVIWDVATASKRTKSMSCFGLVLSMTFSPDGTILAAGTADGSVRLWDVASGRMSATLFGHRRPVTAICYAPDGRTLTSGCGIGQVMLWKVATGQGRPLIATQDERGPIRSLAISPDGSILASVDAPTGSPSATLSQVGSASAFASETRPYRR